MHRKLIFLALLTFSSLAMAEQTQLNLQCYLSASSYLGVKDFLNVKEVNLSGLKHTPAGSKKLFELGDYEFWAMTHTVQNIAAEQHINNFQVAVRSKTNGAFFHALSNTVTSGSSEQLSARISLVDYYEGTMSEKGELLFECKTPLE